MSDSDQKQSLFTTVSDTVIADTISQKTKNKNLKQTGILMSVLPLAACGGDSSGGSAPPPDDTPAPAPSTPTPTPTPDFTENPTNVFIAVDGSDSVLSKAAATADLTVTGKGGNDTISTGSGDDIVDGGSGNDIISTGAGDDIVKGGPGNDTISTGTGADLIRGGNGIDAINAGADNDAIVVVGTTSANQYVQADITNPAGSGTDLSGLLTLADLNGRGVSEVSSGETIDGGTGTNTLFIYGTVDLTGVSLTNVTVLVVNSDVTLTAAQMALFTTVDGDGSSVINIEVPPGDTYIIDLSSLNITDIGNLNIEGDVTFIIDDASDLNEIGAINTGSSSDVKVQINGNGGSTNVNLGDIAAKIDNADTIDLAPTVTLHVDDAADIDDLGLNEISGSGNIDTGGNNDIEDALNNNVDVPKPTISINDISVNEAQESATYTVTLSKDYYTSVSVDYTAPDGSSGTLTFNPGETEKTFVTSWADDSTDEANQLVNATLSNPSNATISDSNGQLTILDDDAAPTISIDDISVNEANETATFTVGLSAASGKTITVDYSSPDGSSGTLTFNPGETGKTFVTTWSDDSTDEADEIQNATLSNPSNATIADNSGQLTIIDDDGTPSIRIGDISANEADETATFTVTLSNPSASAVTVDYLAPDGSSGTLTFNPGETEKTFVTTWNDDGIDEADEVVSATLSNASNATISDGNGQLTIIDDDELPTISINDITADEADETATFTVSLSATSGKTITVDYDAPDGSSGTLTFNPGETEKTFTTTWNDDSTDEVNQTVNATLSNPSNATISDDSGKLTIYDNDPIPSISINDISINEAEEIGFFTVSLSAASGKTVSVNYSAPDGSSGTLTFDPGETEKTFTTTWTDDILDEDDFVYFANLSTPTNATISDNQGKLTIFDDDAAPSISINDVIANEADGTATFTISLSAASGKTVTVDYDAPDGSSGTLTFNPGETEKTFVTAWSDDNIIDGDEIQNAILSNPSNAIFADSSGKLTILDDEALDPYIYTAEVNAEIGLKINGEAANDMSGVSVSRLGDVNGDGIDDFIVSALGADINATDTGASYVIYGGSDIGGVDGVIELSDIATGDGSSGFRINGSFELEQSGYRVSNAGDVNNDGYDDILIGSYADSFATADDSYAYLVYGGTNIDGGDGQFDLSSLIGSDGSVGITIGDFNGYSSRINPNGAGDINKDGYDDIIIGTGSESFIIYGATDIGGGNGTVDVYALYSGDGSTGFHLKNEFGTANNGFASSKAGDFNNDGYEDFIVTAYENGAGQAYLVFGGPNIDGGDSVFDLSSIELSDGSGAIKFNGIETFDETGYSVSGGGDINGDGFDDLLIGAPAADNSDDEFASGRIFVVYGGSDVSNGQGNFELSTLQIGAGEDGFIIDGIGSSTNSGRSVSIAGDLNGDGFDDILIGSPYSGGSNGTTSVIYGGSNIDGSTGIFDLKNIGPGDGSQGFVLAGSNSSDYNGGAVSGIGDINDDGFDDLISSADGADPNGSQSGQSYIIYGHATTSDVYMGTNGQDTLNGTDADERFIGRDGNDIIEGGLGADTVSGGDGDDTFIVNQGDNSETEDTFDGENGTDTIILSGLNSVDLSALNGSNIEFLDLHGGNGSTLTFSAQDVIDITDARNTLYISGDSLDSLEASGTWTFDGGYYYGKINEGLIHLKYTNGGATIYVSTEIGTQNGISVSPSTFIETTENTYVSPDNMFSYFSMSESNVDLSVYGSAIIATGSGNDSIYAGNFGLTVNSGSGDDNIVGSDKNDVIYGNEGIDTIDGGANSADGDQLSYYGSPEGININLDTGIGIGGWAEGDIVTNIERVRGTDYADVMTGNDADNIFDGEEGIDTLSGGAGDDRFDLFQVDHSEQDTVDGGDGDDTVVLVRNTLESSHQLDLADLNFTNIENIELTFKTYSTDRDEELTFTAQNVIEVTDADNILYITGGSGDILNTSSTWNYIDQQFKDGIIYNQYQSGGATVFIAVDIIQLNGLAAGPETFTESPANTFTANDNSDSFLSQKSSIDDLTATGKDGDDVIITGSGTDTLNGGAGDDYLIGGNGADIIDGGTNNAGGDWVDYQNSNGNVIVSFTDNTAFGGHAHGDTITNIENIIGSKYDDTLTGDGNANKISGIGGDDEIEGLGGSDTLDGGNGNDILSYSRSASAVNINLQDNTASGGDAEGDIISNFENIFGSVHDDTLTGDDNANIIVGNGGDDTIDGAGGDDTIVVYNNQLSSNTSYDGGTGFDLLDFSIGNTDPFDLSSINATNIEEIGLSTTSLYDQAENVTLTLQDVLDITDSNNELRISTIDNHDSVISTGEGWVQGADQVIDSNTYHSYTAGGATLLIDDDITLYIS